MIEKNVGVVHYFFFVLNLSLIFDIWFKDDSIKSQSLLISMQRLKLPFPMFPRTQIGWFIISIFV